MTIEILCETCHVLAEALRDSGRMEWTLRLPIYAYVVMVGAVTIAALSFAAWQIHNIFKRKDGSA